MNATQARPATKPQFDLIRTLLIELGELDEAAANTWRTELNLARERNQFDVAAASAAIEDLREAKKKARWAKPREAGSQLSIPEVPAGRYALQGEDEDDIKFYVIERTEKGFVTGYAQASDELHKLQFRALVAILRAIETAGLKESAALYGIKLGVCGRCGRTLTSKWRNVGIGPECSKK